MKSLCDDKKSILFTLLGPICLQLGLTALLCRYACAIWPLTAAAFVGFFLIWKWEKRGFFAAVFVLIAAMIALSSKEELFWLFLFCSSVALSWFLLLLGHREFAFRMAEKIQAFEQLTTASEILQTQLHQMRAQNTGLHVKIDEEVKEKENYKQKIQQMLFELTSCQNKEKELERALEEAKIRLFKYKYEQENSKEAKASEVMRAQFAQLREQFEEKSETLHQTRKQLFAMESELLALQKQIQEQAVGFTQEEELLFEMLKQMQDECQGLEKQILVLEQLVSFLLTPKKRPVRTRVQSSTVQEDLFLLNSLAVHPKQEI